MVILHHWLVINGQVSNPHRGDANQIIVHT